MARISDMQRKIYDYMASYIAEKGYPPSVREIGAAVGLKSPSTVHFHLKRMEEAGLIEKDSGKGRAVALTDRKSGRETRKRSLEDWEPQPEQQTDRVPVVGNVAAGSPILAQELIEDYLVFDTGGHPEDYFALRVRGESMRNAGILPGDVVVVRRQESASSGEIVVAMLEDEATVKRLSLRRGKVWLLPENEDYSPIDGTGAKILGKVVGVERRY